MNFYFNGFYNLLFEPSQDFFFLMFISVFYLVFGVNKEAVIKTLLFLLIIGFFIIFLFCQHVEYVGYIYGIVYASGIVIFFFFFTMMIKSSEFKFYSEIFTFGEAIFI